MKQYLELLEHVRRNGVDKGDRTGTGMKEVFGAQMRFDLSKGFPLVTTKKMFLKGIIHELLWFLKGDTNIKYLQDSGVKIWDQWADENGDLGPVYGKQWRKWRDVAVVNKQFNHETREWDDIDPPEALTLEIDQIRNLIDDIKFNPDSRRHIVTAWNPADVGKMALPPCHCLFQFNVQEGRLNCQLYQRSADMFLGVPFNIASYSLLTMMIAQVCDLKPGEFVHTFGSAHIYHNHIEQVDTQLSREPHPLPTMKINPEVKDIDSFTFEDFTLIGYEHDSPIKAPIAV